MEHNYYYYYYHQYYYYYLSIYIRVYKYSFHFSSTVEEATHRAAEMRHVTRAFIRCIFASNSANSDRVKPSSHLRTDFVWGRTRKLSSPTRTIIGCRFLTRRASWKTNSALRARTRASCGIREKLSSWRRQEHTLSAIAVTNEAECNCSRKTANSSRRSPFGECLFFSLSLLPNPLFLSPLNLTWLP